MSLPEFSAPGYIEKLLLPARVVMPGLEELAGAFALSAASPCRVGPESLLELLNTPARVLPVIRDSDEAVLLVTRLAIDWVEVAAGVDPAWIRPPAYMVTREELVEVRMVNGRRVEGRMTMELPDHLNRISDFLNLPDEFFPLVTRTATLLINKAHVAGARLYVGSPRPVGAPADGPGD
jgi:hypothetical protein